MKSPIRQIQFEDGPEDGRVLTRALFAPICPGAERMADEISLFQEDERRGEDAPPLLLGHYRLGHVHRGTATYRWQPA